MLYQLTFYVPETHLDKVKEAIFVAGAGHYQNYDQCCWQTKGEGQYRPLAGSDPFLGKKDQLEKCVEYKVETICAQEKLDNILKALKDAHPYEEPAYAVIALVVLATNVN